MLDYSVKQKNIHVYRSDMSLYHTLFSGQAFRWIDDSEGFFGVVEGNGILAKQFDEEIIFYDCDEDFFINHLVHYFDLSRDYKSLLKEFEADDVLKESVAFAPGIHVLNQPPFETLISFIISANNNLVRIRQIVLKLSEQYGEKRESHHREYYTFPEPERLARAEEVDIIACGAGYRAKYIIDTAKKVANGFDLEALKELSYLEARAKLTSLSGVGKKVADCILLYALEFSGSFPLDVWTKRIVHDVYGFDSKKDVDTLRFIEKKFGKHAGIAQQYLFYYAKQKNLGKSSQIIMKV